MGQNCIGGCSEGEEMSLKEIKEEKAILFNDQQIIIREEKERS